MGAFSQWRFFLFPNGSSLCHIDTKLLCTLILFLITASWLHLVGLIRWIRGWDWGDQLRAFWAVCCKAFMLVLCREEMGSWWFLRKNSGAMGFCAFPASQKEHSIFLYWLEILSPHLITMDKSLGVQLDLFFSSWLVVLRTSWFPATNLPTHNCP